MSGTSVHLHFIVFSDIWKPVFGHFRTLWICPTALCCWRYWVFQRGQQAPRTLQTVSGIFDSSGNLASLAPMKQLRGCPVREGPSPGCPGSPLRHHVGPRPFSNCGLSVKIICRHIASSYHYSFPVNQFFLSCSPALFVPAGSSFSPESGPMARSIICVRGSGFPNVFRAVPPEIEGLHMGASG